jgi:putative hemolysin
MQQTEIEILIIAGLILLNGFFAGAEISMISIRKSRLKNLIDQGNKRAKQVGLLLSQPDKFLATIQVGVTLAGTTASVLGGNALVPYLTPLLVRAGMKPHGAENLAVTLIVVVLAFLLLVVGELIPKYVALNSPERIAFSSAPIINIFSKIAYIPARILSSTARLILLPFGLSGRQTGAEVSAEEINLILSEGHKDGHFEKAERDLIEGVFEFADTTVRRVMTPRTEITAIDLKSTPEEILRRITEEGYSRYPIYEDSLDNIKGVVHTKDIANLLVHSQLIILQDVIRPVTFIPDSKMIHAQLHDFQKNHQHIAIVLDEYGGTAGLITMEDILEEIVGEIRDEHDTELEPFVRISNHLCQVQAQCAIDDFNKQFDVELNEEGRADTVGGLVLDHLGKLPRQGEKVVIGNLQFEIISIDGARIDRMRVRKIEQLKA